MCQWIYFSTLESIKTCLLCSCTYMYLWICFLTWSAWCRARWQRAMQVASLFCIWVLDGQMKVLRSGSQSVNLFALAAGVWWRRHWSKTVANLLPQWKTNSMWESMDPLQNFTQLQYLDPYWAWEAFLCQLYIREKLNRYQSSLPSAIEFPNCRVFTQSWHHEITDGFLNVDDIDFPQSL